MAFLLRQHHSSLYRSAECELVRIFLRTPGREIQIICRRWNESIFSTASCHVQSRHKLRPMDITSLIPTGELLLGSKLWCFLSRCSHWHIQHSWRQVHSSCFSIRLSLSKRTKRGLNLMHFFDRALEQRASLFRTAMEVLTTCFRLSHDR